MGKGIKFGSAVCVIAAAFWACGDDSASPDVDFVASSSSVATDANGSATSGTSGPVAGSSGSAVPGSSGSVVPGENPTSAPSYAAELISMYCSLTPDVVNAGATDIEFGTNKIMGWESNISTETATFTVTGGGTSVTSEINSADPYTGIMVKAPSTVGEYEYQLMYGEKVVCKASLKVQEVTATCDSVAEVFAGYTVGLNDRILGVDGLAASDSKVEIFGADGTTKLGGGTCSALKCDNISIDLSQQPVGEFGYTLKIDGTEKCKGKLKATALSFKPKCSMEDVLPGEKTSIKVDLFGAETNADTKKMMLEALAETTLNFTLTGNGVSQNIAIKGGLMEKDSAVAPTPTAEGVYEYQLMNGSEEVCKASHDVHKLSVECPATITGGLGQDVRAKFVINGLTKTQVERRVYVGNTQIGTAEKDEKWSCNKDFCGYWIHRDVIGEEIKGHSSDIAGVRTCDNEWGCNYWYEMYVAPPPEVGVPNTYRFEAKYGNESVSCEGTIISEQPKITAKCNFNYDNGKVIPTEKDALTISDFKNWPEKYDFPSTLSMHWVGEGIDEVVSVSKSGGKIEFYAPLSEGNFKYVLTYEGNQVCEATLPIKPIKADCSINSAKLSIGNMQNWEYHAPGELEMDLTGSDGTSKKISVAHYYNPGWSLEIPATPGDYTYTLSYAGFEVCTASYTVK